MHHGVMALVGGRGSHNLGHILLNNRVHESVGGQPTALLAVQAVGVAKACGYNAAFSCRSLEELEAALGSTSDSGGPWFIEVEISVGTIGDLPRPDRFSSRLGHLRNSMQA